MLYLHNISCRKNTSPLKLLKSKQKASKSSCTQSSKHVSLRDNDGKREVWTNIKLGSLLLGEGLMGRMNPAKLIKATIGGRKAKPLAHHGILQKRECTGHTTLELSINQKAL